MTRVVSLAGIALAALAVGGCSQALAGDDCIKTANARHEQDRQRLTAKIRELQAHPTGDSRKDQAAFAELMTEIEGAENRFKAAIRNCNAQNR